MLVYNSFTDDEHTAHSALQTIHNCIVIMMWILSYEIRIPAKYPNRTHIDNQNVFETMTSNNVLFIPARSEWIYKCLCVDVFIWENDISLMFEDEQAQKHSDRLELKHVTNNFASALLCQMTFAVVVGFFAMLLFAIAYWIMFAAYIIHLHRAQTTLFTHCKLLDECIVIVHCAVFYLIIPGELLCFVRAFYSMYAPICFNMCECVWVLSWFINPIKFYLHSRICMVCMTA